ncbi:uncharacterized protein KQ657_001566 [Scheffersomyces spartinae]|uniref:Uncharacterized protein n=1 Tax=Scheffersomyces spartinae TaxID=45513 RepID=A0A9P7V812_9ASCO|nr:uncharacterized protein KQ657_001566 [Scheffersomyces spartinae]KAG7192783.1 hypothetical protein KQ657_001566 [Scheffersomyces spartinae]
MPPKVQYSAATTSRITKRLLGTSPKKQNLRKLLPSQQTRVNELTPRDGGPKTQALEIVNYDVDFDYQLSRKDDVLVAISAITEHLWFNDGDIPLKGLSTPVRDEIMEFRRQLPADIITVNQLYTLFEGEGRTFVDKLLELGVREGTVRKFVISNASPVILNNTKFQKVSYGYENIEVICRAESYIPLFISTEELSKEDLDVLIQYGFVTLSSNHLNEIENLYAISYPNCGTFLKLVKNGRMWVVKTLNGCRYKEAIEDLLVSKWEGGPKMTNMRKPYYGYDLDWVLADALGAGIVEVFNTPVGRGWKLTGKI